MMSFKHVDFPTINDYLSTRFLSELPHKFLVFTRVDYMAVDMLPGPGVQSNQSENLSNFPERDRTGSAGRAVSGVMEIAIDVVILIPLHDGAWLGLIDLLECI